MASRWALFTSGDEFGCGETWYDVERPGPDDDWHGEIPFDGRPAPTFPITLNFGNFSSGRNAPNTFPVDHVGFWINHVPAHGIPKEFDKVPSQRDFLDWMARDYAFSGGKPFTDEGQPIEGCLVKEGAVVIPTHGTKDHVYAAIEITGKYTAVLHGYVWGWDFNHRLFDGELERGTSFALYPLEDVERW
jgi:hypothetical protein